MLENYREFCLVCIIGVHMSSPLDEFFLSLRHRELLLSL